MSVITPFLWKNTEIMNLEFENSPLDFVVTVGAELRDRLSEIVPGYRQPYHFRELSKKEHFYKRWS